MPLEGAQAQGEAGDVPEPVDARPDRPGGVLELEEELSDHVDRVEPLSEVVAPAVASSQPVAKPQRREREHATGGDGDRPRHRQTGARLVDVVEEEQDRDDAGGRRKQRVLERAEAEHAHARLAIVDELLPECMQVDGEPSTRDEHTEARRNERERAGVGQARPILDPSDLSVSEHVTDVREHLRGDRERQPAGVDVAKAVGDSAESGGPGDADHCRGGQGRAQRDERGQLAGAPVQMCPAAKGAWELHKRGIGTPLRSQTPQSGHAVRFRAGTVRADRFGEDSCR